MAPIPIDPDYMWNYSFCELMDFRVKIDDDWYSIGNIEYNALDDLQDDFSQLFEDDVVPVDGWEEIAQEPTEHDTDDTTYES
jgi:hypothetical protein